MINSVYHVGGAAYIQINISFNPVYDCPVSELPEHPFVSSRLSDIVMSDPYRVSFLDLIAEMIGNE